MLVGRVARARSLVDVEVSELEGLASELLLELRGRAPEHGDARGIVGPYVDVDLTGVPARGDVDASELGVVDGRAGIASERQPIHRAGGRLLARDPAGDVGLRVHVRGGGARCGSAFRRARGRIEWGAQLDGGSLSFTARGRADDLEGEPVNVSLELDTAQVGGVGAGDAVRALRFAVPLLAGIAPDAAQVDFQSVVTMEVSAKGPAMPADEQDVVTWIEQWSGQGRVALRTGSFTPSTEISRLLEMTGQSGKFAFDDLSTSFALDAGALATEAMQLEYQGRKIGLRGQTTIRGALDYQLDVASLLRGHRDGDKILEYIDPATLTAGLTGTLDAPSLTIPSFEALLQSAAQKALEKEASKQIDPLKQKAEEELQRALRRIFGR